MYNVLGELCVVILSGIMLFNLFMSFTVFDHIHRLFFLCALLVFLSALTNIISINCIRNFRTYPRPLCNFITTLYFIQMGLIPYSFTVYGYNFASVYHRHKRNIYSFLAFPLIVYTFFVLLNIKTGLLFYYDPVKGYTRGIFKNMTYIMSGIYSLSMMVIAVFNKKYLAPRVFIVFLLYPVISVMIIGIQFFIPHFVMTGTSSFALLMLIYLTIQSDLIEYDISTNLLTEKYLDHVLSKGYKGKFAVITIRNFAAVQENLGIEATKALIFNLSKGIARLFNKNAFVLDSTRFAVLADDMSKIKNSVPVLNEIIRQVKSDYDARCNIDIHIAGLSMPENATSYRSAMDIVNRLLLKMVSKDDEPLIVCTDTYVSQIEREKLILNILKRELRLDSQQFQIFFQPIYSVETGKLLYAEVLSRLLNTEIGDIPPVEFVGVAENYGLIENLGMVAFEKACQFMYDNRGFVDALSINFSVSQMKKPTIVNDVLAVLKRYSLPPSSVIIEITESIFIDDFALIRERMIELARNGILFYLDDFGTGYSNFANIVELPFSTIKFDRAMLLAMEKSVEGSRLLISLIDAFKDNKLKVLIEGVESEAQNELVKKSGADFVQGFLFSQPLYQKDFLHLRKGGEA